MSIANKYPAANGTLETGDSFSCEITHTSATEVEVIVGGETAWTLTGGAEAGYEVTKFTLSGVTTIEIARTSGWSGSPLVVQVVVTGGAEAGTTSWSYYVGTQTTYPTGTAPYNEELETNVTVVSGGETIAQHVAIIDVDDTTMRALKTGDQRVKLFSEAMGGGGTGGGLGTWAYESDLNGNTDPGAGFFHTNNASILSATQLYINVTDAHTRNFDYLFTDLAPGNHLIFRDSAGEFAVFSLTVVSDQTTHYQLVGSFVVNSADFAPSDGSELVLEGKGYAAADPKFGNVAQNASPGTFQNGALVRNAPSGWIYWVPFFESTNRDPLVTDDDGDQYGTGTLWYNSFTGSVFVCLDATTGAAVWQVIYNAGAVTELGTYTFDDTAGTPNANGEAEPNNNDPGATTSINFYDSDAGGTDVSATLLGLGIGDTISFDDGEGNFTTFTVDGTVVDNTTYVTVPVANVTDGRGDFPITDGVNIVPATPSTTDGDAIHDNVAGEISAITEKGSPVSADLIVIEDSADSFNKKKVQIGNLPGGTGGGGGGLGTWLCGSVADAAPASGGISFDSGTPASVTTVKVSETSSDLALAQILNDIIRGIAVLRATDGSGYSTYSITDYVDSGTYGTYTVTPLDYSGTFAAAKNYTWDIYTKQNALSGSGAPGTGTGNYRLIGAPYVNTTSGEVYFLVDNTPGANVWSSPTGAGSGDVVGPASALDNAIARYDLTTGKLIQGSLATVTDTGGMSLSDALDMTSDNIDNITYLTLDEGAGASTPAAGHVALYAKAADGLLYSKDDAGVETLVSGGAGGGGGGSGTKTLSTNETVAVDATEVVIGGGYIDGSTGGTYSWNATWIYNDGGGASTQDAELRLYDDGGTLRSTLLLDSSVVGLDTLTYTTQALTASGTPGTDADQILNSTDIYEVRLYITATGSLDSVTVYACEFVEA